MPAAHLLPSPIDADDDFPVPRDYKAVDVLLTARGYNRLARDEVIAHVGRYGTAECGPVHEDDRADVESLLPGSPQHWPEWTDWYVYNATGFEVDG